MDLLWHINFVEMLGDLTVATFLILLAASVGIVGCMVLLPLIDLAFEKKRVTRPLAHDESWRAGRPWLQLRSDFLRQLMSGLPQVQRKHLTLVHDSDQSHHLTPLIKRRRTATQTNTNLIVEEEARPNRASTPSNAA